MRYGVDRFTSTNYFGVNYWRPRYYYNNTYAVLIDEIHGATTKTDERIRIETRRVEEVRRKDSCKCTCSKSLSGCLCWKEFSYGSFTVWLANKINIVRYPFFCKREKLQVCGREKP